METISLAFAIKITFLPTDTFQLFFLCFNIVILVSNFVQAFCKFCCCKLIARLSFCIRFVIVNLLQAGRSHAISVDLLFNTVAIWID